MHQSILYVEDDETLSIGVSGYLQKMGFNVHTAATVTEAKNILSKYHPDLSIIDWNLPDGNGDRLCLWIQERWKDIPVIYLTVRGDKKDMLQGFKTGADDYIVKPFDLELLYSRIRAILKRSGKAGKDELICGPITLNKCSLKIHVDGAEVILSSMEYQLLLLLMENKNHTLTRGRLLEAVWDANGCFVNDNTLTVAMKRLREKLHNPVCIKTLRSLGYRMEDEI